MGFLILQLNLLLFLLLPQTHISDYTYREYNFIFFKRNKRDDKKKATKRINSNEERKGKEWRANIRVEFFIFFHCMSLCSIYYPCMKKKTRIWNSKCICTTLRCETYFFPRSFFSLLTLFLMCWKILFVYCIHTYKQIYSFFLFQG